MIVKELMKKPRVINKDINLKKASELMKKDKINSLIIVKGNKPVGIITLRDIADNFGANKKVFSVMKKKPVVITQDSNVADAISLVKSMGVNKLPVVDKNRDLVGIITVKDLLIYACEVSDFLVE